MTVHKLKLLPDYFDAVVNGIKTFEIRKYDRDYKVGDTLRLYEFDPEKEEFSKLPKTRTCDVAVTYILTHEDFPDGSRRITALWASGGSANERYEDRRNQEGRP